MQGTRTIANTAASDSRRQRFRNLARRNSKAYCRGTTGIELAGDAPRLSCGELLDDSVLHLIELQLNPNISRRCAESPLSFTEESNLISSRSLGTLSFPNNKTKPSQAWDLIKTCVTSVTTFLRKPARMSTRLRARLVARAEPRPRRIEPIQFQSRSAIRSASMSE